MRTLKKSVLYPHPVEDVWAALTSGEALAEWLMPNTFEEPVEGAAFRFQYDPDPICASGIVECRILKVDAPYRMIWEWQNGPMKAGGPKPPIMQVEWILKSEANGTRLTLIQTGLKGQPWFIPYAMSFGWGAYLKRLLPVALRNVEAGQFTPGAIPMEKRLYKATNLPPEVKR